MVMVAVACPFCKYRLKFPADAQGEAVACTSCNKRFRIKAEEPPAVPEADDTYQPARRMHGLGAGEVCRIVAWVLCVVFCLAQWNHFMDYMGRSQEPSAIQQAAAAAQTLVTMFLIFVIARAVDACTRR